MTAKKRPPQDEDPAQSKRFLDLAAELEADGGLNPTEGEAEFERVLTRAPPPRRRLSVKGGRRP